MNRFTFKYISKQVKVIVVFRCLGTWICTISKWVTSLCWIGSCLRANFLASLPLTVHKWLVAPTTHSIQPVNGCTSQFRASDVRDLNRIALWMLLTSAGTIQFPHSSVITPCLWILSDRVWKLTSNSLYIHWKTVLWNLLKVLLLMATSTKVQYIPLEKNRWTFK